MKHFEQRSVSVGGEKIVSHEHHQKVGTAMLAVLRLVEYYSSSFHSDSTDRYQFMRQNQVQLT